jgi:hypothetical protein
LIGTRTTIEPCAWRICHSDKFASRLHLPTTQVHHACIDVVDAASRLSSRLGKFQPLQTQQPESMASAWQACTCAIAASCSAKVSDTSRPVSLQNTMTERCPMNVVVRHAGYGVANAGDMSRSLLSVSLVMDCTDLDGTISVKSLICLACIRAAFHVCFR